MPVRGESFREMVHLQRRVNSLFEEMLQPGTAPAQIPEYSWSPATDIYEDEKSFYIEVELPGVRMDEVEVTSEDDSVRVRGRRQSSREMTRETVQRIERFFGPFERSFQFPAPVTGSKILARLEHGVLSLKVPKASPRRRIRIE
jgi:HSP20 family protein